MVAESFRHLPVISNIFEEGGRFYVRVQLNNGGIRKVRWYPEKEGKKNIMTKTSAFDLEPITKTLPNAKELLGFGDKGYITIFKGNTEATRDWFAYNGRYSKIFGWYFPSEKKYTTLPYDIEPIQLYWDEITENDNLLSDDKIKGIIDIKKYGTSISKFVGKIGDRIETTVTVSFERDLKNDYGVMYFHVFEDANGNKYTWTTNVKKLNVGDSYNLTGTVKELRRYKGEEQTVLTRCKVNEI